MVRLCFDFPEEDQETILLTTKIVVGSDPDVDFCIQDYGLAPQHLVFRQKQGVVSVINLGNSDSVKINKFKLQHGKKYLLAEDDVVVIDEIEIFTHRLQRKNRQKKMKYQKMSLRTKNRHQKLKNTRVVSISMISKKNW